MKVQRVSQSDVYFDFTVEQRRVRGIIPLTQLEQLLSGKEAAAKTALIGAKGAIKLVEFVNQYYFQHRSLTTKPSTIEGNKKHLVALLSTFGNKYLHEIDKFMVQDYRQLRTRGELSTLKSPRPCSPNTINNEHSVLSTIMNAAVDLGFLQINPLAGLKYLAGKKRVNKWFRREQIILFLRQIKSPIYRKYMKLFFYTGRRPNELYYLNEEDINKSECKIYFHKSKQRLSKDQEKNPFVWLDYKPLGPKVVGFISRLKGHPKTGYIFADPKNGKPYSSRKMQKNFNKVRAKMGGVFLERHSYDARHTFAMHAAMAGLDFNQLRMYLSHSTPNAIQWYLDDADGLSKEGSIFYQKSSVA